MIWNEEEKEEKEMTSVSDPKVHQLEQLSFFR